jgi:FAD:protein FMN transferase
LDFGGIGKGYLLDNLSKMISSRHVAGYWLSLGGDIICSGHDVDGQPWRVGVQNATESTENIQYIENRHGDMLAIATSGTTKRKGIRNGTKWHHIIDPRSGLPAETDILTVTATAKSAVIGDVYAKVAVIAGSKEAVRILRKEKQLDSFILQLEDGSVIRDSDS